MALNYKGNWDASNNIPYLINGSGIVGDIYNISVSGSQDLGSGLVNYIYNYSLIYTSSNTWIQEPINYNLDISNLFLSGSTYNFLGDWDANSNTPILSNSTGSLNQVYRIISSGSQDLDSGLINYITNNSIIYTSLGQWAQLSLNYDYTTNLISGSSGSTTIPTLEEVLTAGNTADKSINLTYTSGQQIFINGLGHDISIGSNQIELDSSSGTSAILDSDELELSDNPGNTGLLTSTSFSITDPIGSSIQGGVIGNRPYLNFFDPNLSSFSGKIILGTLSLLNKTYTLPDLTGTIAIKEFETLQVVTDQGSTTSNNLAVQNTGYIANLSSSFVGFNNQSTGYGLHMISQTGIPFLRFTQNFNGDIYPPVTITAPRTYYLPDESGTIALISDIPPATSGTVTQVAASGSTGISISGSPITTSGTLIITNTSPDQIVSLSGSTGISTGGTYPNFNITNTLPDKTVILTPTTGISVSGAYPNFTIGNTLPSSGGTIVVISGGTGLTASPTNPITTSGSLSVNTSQNINQLSNLTTNGMVKTSGSTGQLYIDTTNYLTSGVTSIATDSSLSGGTIVNTGTLGINFTNANTWTGTQTYQFNSLVTTPTDALFIVNNTSATSGSTIQVSPAFHFQGQSWATGAAASQHVDWRIYDQPISGVIVSGNLLFQSSLNSAAYVTQATLSSGGLFSPGSILIAGAGTLSVAGTTTLSSTTNINGNTTFGLSKKINITTGTNAIAGVATLSSGTVTVSTTAVTASSLIWVQYQSGIAFSIGVGNLSVTVKASSQTAGIGFVITAYTIQGLVNTTDNSAVQWWFFN